LRRTSLLVGSRRSKEANRQAKTRRRGRQQLEVESRGGGSYSSQRCIAHSSTQAVLCGSASSRWCGAWGGRRRAGTLAHLPKLPSARCSRFSFIQAVLLAVTPPASKESWPPARPTHEALPPPLARPEQYLPARCTGGACALLLAERLIHRRCIRSRANA